ncbi:bifunctional 4-hydroxy-2-oxoglutarate aldolase/2-dehydro-3-deoxy-phosphogluconate aldolase [Faecalicatena contorta]|uniref:2-dehydro-3-deoxyphosphogluconate aldolase / (4S)-4-hydroxy-2-oxoglutarate aldolase n=1 Tax=Faecalicatena contorta TaxID=39482 RepID=A0A315ZUP8_9FIRM|nr:bifunctional 4-hydroxy-2-oxoglutarate aldolase/2-dehydro-3-deoxy-phosphogluconate aldolase [Faecalicatena contorta]PWJ49215.1 2-dehydro-3-deoxyphosphogluconate aldolase/(4S)-4-hydroxy-2-oxoglutarate aldolase [Faecalicatena contorta]SUQ14920.1 2-dehydro-3-deoxyphosphogluconate aldolase / (4S)-4-hydroxy-2-oxoglutarate aldolase [Faecalicatena contorta]
MTREKIIANIRNKKVIAIVRDFEPKQCVKLAQALYAGGINMIEVTFDQSRPDAYAETTEAIRAIRDHFAGEVIPGAGTVMTVEQVDLAKEAGAFYIISPDTNIEVIRYTRKAGLVSLPGAMTPTEAVSAHQAGADMIKLFPIANLGASYLKALKAPLKHIDFMAVGGVSPENIQMFIKAGAAGAGVGGLLTKKALVEAGEFEKITELARRYVENANA